MSVVHSRGRYALVHDDVAALILRNVLQRTTKPMIGTDENEALVRVERQFECVANGLHVIVSLDKQMIRRDMFIGIVRGE